MWSRIALVLLALCGIWTASRAEIIGGGFTGVFKPAGGGGASYAFQVGGTASGSSSSTSFSLDTGTAAADRYLVLGVCLQNTAITVSSVTINGTTLTQDTTRTSANESFVYSALVTTGSGTNGGSNVVINSSATFVEHDVFLWKLNGLNSNAVKHVGSAATPSIINVTSGDFLFAVDCVTGQPTIFAASTETPAANHTQGSFGASADWTIASTNASFSVVDNGAGGRPIVAASYR